MSDLIERQAAIDAVKWGASVLSIRDAIARLPGVWKPASEKPVKEARYLVVCGKPSPWYTVLYYGKYEDWKMRTVKHGWCCIDDGDNIDYDDDVSYWTELPEMPEVEE